MPISMFPFRDSQTVLDVVTYIQRHLDATLAYSFACRVGVCGSCAMTVNGAPRWTCRTHVSKVRPRRQAEDRAAFEHAGDQGPRLPTCRAFFEQWREAEGRFHGTRTRHEEVERRVAAASPARQAADAGIECINCAVCYSACDVVAWNTAYLGPAALNRAWTLAERHSRRRSLPRSSAP